MNQERVGTEPEFRVEGKKLVTGGKVFEKRSVWVITRGVLLKDDAITFEELICLVPWQKEGKTFGQ